MYYRIIMWIVFRDDPLYHCATGRREISRRNILRSHYQDQIDRLLPLLDRCHAVAQWDASGLRLVVLCRFCRGEIDIRCEFFFLFFFIILLQFNCSYLLMFVFFVSATDFLVEHARIGGDVCPVLRVHFSIENIRLLQNTPRDTVATVSQSTIDPEPLRNIICVICLELEVAAFVLIPCGHQFCRDCLFSFADCPICKTPAFGALRSYPTLERSSVTGATEPPLLALSHPALPQPSTSDTAQPSSSAPVHPSTNTTARPFTYVPPLFDLDTTDTDSTDTLDSD
jgi:hypothetical protein